GVAKRSSAARRKSASSATAHLRGARAVQEAEDLPRTRALVLRNARDQRSHAALYGQRVEHSAERTAARGGEGMTCGGDDQEGLRLCELIGQRLIELDRGVVFELR